MNLLPYWGAVGPPGTPEAGKPLYVPPFSRAGRPGESRRSPIGDSFPQVDLSPLSIMIFRPITEGSNGPMNLLPYWGRWDRPGRPKRETHCTYRHSPVPGVPGSPTAPL